VQGLEALFALRAIGQQVDDVPLVAAMAAAIQTPSGGTDRFDERRKRRIADQILFVPRAARRQRDHAIEQRASLEEPKVC